MKNKTIGYAYVVADLLHFGHTLHLKNCKGLCDKLVVGVLTDEATCEKKPKPIMGFKERLGLVGDLDFVDAVVAQETYSPGYNVEAIKPDILFEITSHKHPSKNPHGRVIVLPYFPTQSSIEIKKQIKKTWNGGE